MRGNNYAKYNQSHKFERASVAVKHAREAIKQGDALRSLLAGKRILEVKPNALVR